MAETGQLYKIKLSSGRIVGPVGIQRVRQLVLKKHVTGSEVAREYPNGEWREISAIPELAAVLFEKLRREVAPDGTDHPSKCNKTKALSATQILPGATVALKNEEAFVPLPEPTQVAEGKAKELAPPEGPAEKPLVEAPQFFPGKQEEEEGKTRVEVETKGKESTNSEMDATKVDQYEDQLPAELKSKQFEPPARRISQEKTVVFQKRTPGPIPQAIAAQPKGRRMKRKDFIRATIIAVLLGYVAYDVFFEDEAPKGQSPIVIRPQLPKFAGTVEAEKSAQAFAKALPFYLQDNVLSYAKAVSLFRSAAQLDGNNIKALALLASSYLNLIDSSNKDESYFSVILKLIELSRARNIDLPETVISDVEFFITVNKPEAAQNRIVEYTRTHPKYGIEMFYYLALAFYHRGEMESAAKYLAQISDQAAFSPKVFYLRGLIAERLEDYDAALSEFGKALKFSASHAKSRLKLVEVLAKKGNIKAASKHLSILIKAPDRLSPKDLASAYHHYGNFCESSNKLDLAMGAYERAVEYDPGNHEFQLELYTMRAKAGRSIKKFQKDARMYFFLSDGERYFKENKYQDALNQFLQARISNDKSYIPLIKLGELYLKMNDIANARDSFRKAAELSKNKVEIWSKYINTLIQSYEWEEAQEAMDRFRKLPVSQSAIDKAAADIIAKQGKHAEAQMLYQKAMSRDQIDPDVYVAYGNSLIATGNCKEAPLFFAITLRFDPLNFEALKGTARCIAATDGIDQGISMLQDELKKTTSLRAELLTAIAEFQLQKGAFDQAQESVNQAFAANPDYGPPWKLQAQLYLDRQAKDRRAVEKALEAYRSYSDRNPSDPSGYLSRYEIFLARHQYDKAEVELERIWVLYPKYPNLYVRRGKLKALQGNFKEAVNEFDQELKNNPNNADALSAKGKSLIELKQLDLALVSFQKAMAIRPTDPDAKFYAGFANQLLQNFAGAVALYQAALAFDKGNSLIYKRLGEAYLAMGDRPNAGAAFRKYVELEPDAPDRVRYEKFR